MGTRGSLLARVQSQQVADALERLHPGLRIEVHIVKTSGDQITDRPLHEFGGKGLFTKELERALLDEQIDFAVHSFKDVPVTMPLVAQEDLVVAAIPKREDPRDVLVSPDAAGLDNLPRGAKVGTGSLRRRCQLLAIRPDLQIEGIRGNIDTRLRKLRAGDYAAVVLAVAGLKRAALYDSTIMQPLEANRFVPSAGQGALCLQCRRADDRTRSMLGAMHDPTTAACVRAERELVLLLEGDCHSPIAAFASIIGTELELRAAVGRRGGQPPVLYAQGRGSADTPEVVAQQVFKSLLDQGVRSHLHG
jgi:hydroxymethylbilane synthase